MANYQNLKDAIRDVIKTNGNQEITGAIMQNALVSIISTIGSNYTFAGVAKINTNPGTPDQNVFYLASTPGVYPNFGLTISNNLSIIKNNLSGEWEVVEIAQMVVDYYGDKYLAKGDIDRTGYNIASINDFKKGFYFDSKTDGYGIKKAEVYYMSPFYKVTPGVQYRVNPQQIIWFDKDYNRIGSQVSMNGAVQIITAPENAEYIILNVTTSSPIFMLAEYPYTSSYGFSRFYRVLAETSRLDLFPLWQEMPLSQKMVDLGLNRFLINGYINMEYDSTKLYSFVSINPVNKILKFYRYNINPIQSLGLEFLGDFTGEKIENSKFWLMKNQNSANPANGSWFIVDWDAIKQDEPATISNLYGFEGWALSEKIFSGGIWSQFASIDFVEQIEASLKTDINVLGIGLDNINERWAGVFNDNAILENAQQWETDNFQNENAASVFSGWGCHIGIRKNFNAVELCIINRGSDPITQLRVAFYDTNYEGQKLSDKTVNVNVLPGEEKNIIVQLDNTIANEENKVLFLMYWCNQFVTRKGYKGEYPYTTSAGYTSDRYSTRGNMTINTTSAIPAPFYFRVGNYKINSTLTDEQIENIASRLDIEPEPIESIKISLPDVLYATVGDTLQLFFRGIIQAVDPYKYDILITCSKGNKYPRYYQYLPTVSDVGTTSFTITIKDNNRNVLATKTCQLITRNVVKSPTTNINVACFGDSLTSAGTWCAEADRRLTGSGGTPAGKGLNNIKFVGSKQNGTTGYFGVGGWSWKSYTQKGRPAYRFEVTGVSSLTVGSKYSNNGNTFTIMEVNVTEGNGNILCSVSSLTPQPLESGTLTKTEGDGDKEVTYTSVAEDTQNPLWDNDQNKMSFIPYANSVADGKIDVVYTLLSWNGQQPGRTDFTNVLSQVKIFADTLHAEFPDAKLKLLGIQVPSVRGGMGANYGATGTSYADGYGMVVTALNQNEAYQQFANQPEYSDFVEFVNISTQFDSEYNMPHANRYVNVRNTTTEWIDINGLHPDTSGYYQIADVVYRNFIANFCQ